MRTLKSTHDIPKLNVYVKYIYCFFIKYVVRIALLMKITLK